MEFDGEVGGPVVCISRGEDREVSKVAGNIGFRASCRKGNCTVRGETIESVGETGGIGCVRSGEPNGDTTCCNCTGYSTALPFVRAREIP